MVPASHPDRSAKCHSQVRGESFQGMGGKSGFCQEDYVSYLQVDIGGIFKEGVYGVCMNLSRYVVGIEMINSW